MPLLLPIFLKPPVLQQLLRRWPIPPIHLHYSPNEFLILLADLPLRCPWEWRCLWFRDLLHKKQDSRDCLRACNLFVFRRERPKVSELPLENLQSVLFMAVRYCGGAEKVEVATIDQTYQLHIGRPRSAIHSVLRLYFELTSVPNDQMSVAVFQGVSITTSGLLHMGAPTGVPPLAYSESAGYVPPRSPSWTSENRISPSL